MRLTGSTKGGCEKIKNVSSALPLRYAREICMLNIRSSMEALVVQLSAIALRVFAEGGFHGIRSGASTCVCTSSV